LLSPVLPLVWINNLITVRLGILMSADSIAVFLCMARYSEASGSDILRDHTAWPWRWKGYIHLKLWYPSPTECMITQKDTVWRWLTL
jgi:hypothetical protein